MTPVKFAIACGFCYYAGTVSLRDRTLRVHWQPLVYGLIPARMRDTEVPIDEIADLTIHARAVDLVFRQSALWLRPRDVEAFRDLPWVSRGRLPGSTTPVSPHAVRVQFPFNSCDVAAVEDLVHAIRSRQSATPAAGKTPDYPEPPFAAAARPKIGGDPANTPSTGHHGGPSRVGSAAEVRHVARPVPGHARLAHLRRSAVDPG